MTIHGALVEVAGVGVLLLGRSGIGKSECALELVSRGHRLVADDVVVLRVDAEGRLRGSSPESIRHHMEIRGIGIIYVPDHYGAESVAEEASIDLVCRVERWQPDAEYERVGLDRATETVAGIELPYLRLPARPGASMATIVEVAAAEHQRRARGMSAAEQLDARVRREMDPGRT
jgi:HPr kinase/phosphorylase